MTITLGKLFLVAAVGLFLAAALGLGALGPVATVPLGLASLALGHLFP